ncbi:MAG: hypothetical protein D6712_13500 [Chloroflexi bacterium]|nr:MAG: hypothetical protein D6712_13500 [Chloroflexota bacterium]
MAVEVFWDDEAHTILHYRFTGDWTWSEYFQALPKGRDMMAEVRHYVCIINNMLETDHVPSAFLSRARSVINSRPENTGLVVFVSTGLFFRNTYETFAQLYPNLAKQYVLTNSLDKAHEWIDNWLKQHGG